MVAAVARGSGAVSGAPCRQSPSGAADLIPGFDDVKRSALEAGAFGLFDQRRRDSDVRRRMAETGDAVALALHAAFATPRIVVTHFVCAPDNRAPGGSTRERRRGALVPALHACGVSSR